MDYKPSFQDIAHLGHVEILTPKLDESVAFFKDVMGLHESGRRGDSVFLRAWGDYALHTLQLTGAKTSGVGHFAFRTKSADVLKNMTDYLQKNGVKGEWLKNEFGHGPAFRFPSPDGHAIELYYETKRYVAEGDNIPGFKNQPQRYIPRGIAPRRLDHINLLASDVKACREFFRDLLGMRVTEQIIFDDQGEMGAWLATTLKSYDIAFTKDHKGARGRFHHLTYFMDCREDVLRAADILVERGIFIETGPHKHSIGQTFFLYFYEPGGNRFEIGSGGYLILDPDWKPVVWSKAERMKGQAWGLQTVSTFHTYGTPPVD
ncbi:MAG: catechol 2,3-dioxygenase [Candidatus Acidiferrales bacterium]